MRYITITFLTAIIFIASCGEMSTMGDRVAISVIASPSTAGTVLTSGGDEIGNTAEFLAVPNDGWQFAGWSGDIETAENPLSVVLEEDIRLIANFEVFTNDYTMDLLVYDHQTAVELSFGQKNGATDSYDSGIDQEAPPAAPKSLHSWFYNDERRLFRDFRNSLSSEVSWDLHIETADSDSVHLEWSLDRDELLGSMILTDSQGSFKIDMLADSTAHIDMSEFDYLLIQYNK
jgi:hypothetical protein